MKGLLFYLTNFARTVEGPKVKLKFVLPFRSKYKMNKNKTQPAIKLIA